MIHDLREVLRAARGRPPEPTAAVLDSSTLQSTPERTTRRFSRHGSVLRSGTSSMGGGAGALLADVLPMHEYIEQWCGGLPNFLPRLIEPQDILRRWPLRWEQYAASTSRAVRRGRTVP